MARHVSVHVETELVRDKGITNISDSKQQRNSSIYQGGSNASTSHLCQLLIAYNER